MSLFVIQPENSSWVFKRISNKYYYRRTLLFQLKTRDPNQNTVPPMNPQASDAFTTWIIILCCVGPRPSPLRLGITVNEVLTDHGDCYCLRLRLPLPLPSPLPCNTSCAILWSVCVDARLSGKRLTRESFTNRGMGLLPPN